MAAILEEAVWVGGERGVDETILSRLDLEVVSIPAAGLHGVGLKALPGNLLQLARGFFKSRSILRRVKPDVLFFTGGYLAVPVALAGWRVPSLVYVPDIEPGLALRSIARLADKIAVTAERSRDWFYDQEKVEVTGYPVRSELQVWTREAALEAFELDEDHPVLLVFGGSKGARSLNQALHAVLPELLKRAAIIHITGRLDWPRLQGKKENLPGDLAERYRMFPYLHERMGAALQAADLVVSRAGASVLGEFPHFGLPAVLVPYPHAWRYQRVNAEYLVERGAAVMVRDQELETELLATLTDLLDDEERLLRMKENMIQAAHPGAAQSIAALLLRISGAAQGEISR